MHADAPAVTRAATHSVSSVAAPSGAAEHGATVPRPIQRTGRRICLVGSGFHFLGGLSVYTCRLANALAREHHVSVIPLRRLIPRRLYPGGHRAGQPLSGIRYDDRVVIGPEVDWHWGAALSQAVAFMRDQRPDVLVLQWWTAATLHTYLALSVAARRLGIPVVLEFHELQDTGEAEFPLVQQYRRRLMPLLLRRISGALVHNDHDRRLLLGAYPAELLRDVRIDLVPHGPYDHLLGPDGSPPDPETDDPDALNAAAVADEVTRLLYFGLIRPYKGVEDLVAAFDGLTDEQVRRFELTVVGETWENWTQPADAIAASRHRDRIRFVNRYVTDQEATSYFGAADALVLPYRRGSSSGPLHIAMSHGIHAVLYGVGGLPEAVADYDGATLVPPGDVSALRSAILTLPERRAERFSNPHSWDANCAALEAMIDAMGRTE